MTLRLLKGEKRLGEVCGARRRCRVKKAIILAAILIFASSMSYCQEEKAHEPQALFYTANNDYASGDYAKALAAYSSILNMDLENGALYYNMANSFFKMGKLGYAVLFYEKAR